MMMAGDARRGGRPRERRAGAGWVLPDVGDVVVVVGGPLWGEDCLPLRAPGDMHGEMREVALFHM